MEEFIALVVGLVGLGLLVMPVISLVFATRARRALRTLKADTELQETKLTYLYEQVEGLKATITALKAAPAIAAPEPVAAASDDAPTLAPVETPEVEGSLDDTAPSPPADTSPALQPAARVQAEAPPAAPPPAPAEPAPPAEPPPPPVPLEERMATLFTRVGAGALVLGVLYFFKYAVDNEWIGPSGRVLAGVLTGLIVIGAAEFIRARTAAGYVHALSGVGLAILYVSAYASAAWYHLVGLEVAFGATAVILGFGAALAWRYRAEAVLVLVLVAGLLTPKLLSTGHDRPLALFAYLLLLTSAVLFVSVQRRFRIAIGLAVLGVHLMAAGWYATFFEVHDYRAEQWAGDSDPADLVGAYHEFGPRIVPLVFTALFGAQWIFSALFLRRRPEGEAAKVTLQHWVVPLATIAAVFMHVAACALLYDRPIALGVAMIVVGGASVLCMRTLAATRWLMVPMAAAFLALVGLSQEARGHDQTILLVLLGLWTAVYVGAFLKDALAQSEVISRADAIRTQVAVHGFGALACLMLLPEQRAIAAGATVTLVAAAAAFVADRAKQPMLLLIGQSLTLGGLLLTATVARMEPAVAWHPALLGLAVLWAAAHAIAAIRLSREELPAVHGLIALSGALLGALAVCMISTHDSAPTLRALATGATGLVSLGLATLLKRRGPALETWTSTLAALSLGLFATAIAFGLSGAPVTVLWAALTAIAGTVVAQSRTRVWLVTLQVLAAATLWRLAAVDIADAAQLTRRFYYSQGAEGLLSLPVLFNARAYALVGTGVGFLVGAGVLARSLNKQPDSPHIPQTILLATAGVIAVLGYGLLTSFAIIETRAALSQLPAAPPMALDTAEFDAFWLTVDAARAARAATLDVATTMVLGVIGVALVAIGFAFKDPFHRYLGLVVLLITIGKLIAWDVWKVSRIYRVVVLTAIGGLLLVSGFLYARLKVLFTKGSISTGAGLVLLSLGLAGSAHAQASAIQAHRFKHRATVQGVESAGDHRLVVPAELFDKSESSPAFEDLRLADAKGNLVPFVLQAVPANRPSKWVGGTMFDSGLLPDGGARALFELPEGTEHCEVSLRLSGGGAYLRRTSIESGATQDDLQTISSGAIVYAAEVEGHRFKRSRVRYPQSIARYLRVTLGPDADAPETRIEGADFACRPPHAHAPRDERTFKVVSQTQDPDTRATTITLDAGQAGLPIERLDLSIAQPTELVRRVQVQSSSFEQVWPAVGSGVLFRVAGAAPSEDLSLSVRPAKKRWFRLVVDNGDNPPLQVDDVRGSWRQQEILFRTTEAGPVTLYVGASVSRPRFDLEDILARRSARPEYRPAQLSEVQANPTFGQPDAGRAVPMTERYRGPIGIALAVLLLGMGFWAIRLVRGGQPT